MENFVSALKNLANLTTTENGAVTHRSSKSFCLDLFSRGGAMRSAGELDIAMLVENAFQEDPLTTLRILFYLRDIRGGQGERRFFRAAIKHIALNHPTSLKENIIHIPTVGRFDDLMSLMDTPVENQTLNLLRSQLLSDMDNKTNPSLLAKWMPSINTSSKATRALAHKMAKTLGMTPRVYRKTLSKLRAKLDVLERTLSAKNWSNVVYPKVPSVASLKYRKAFKKHDEMRYTEYLSKVEKGEAKINTAALTPYDLVKTVMSSYDYDKTVQLQWDNLPDLFNGKEHNALVVADVSGSMSGDPMIVCLSLAIYIAERNKGRFHNTFMTFSENPSVQELQGKNLKEKVSNLMRAEWNMSTNLEKAFKLILKIAKDNELPQSELPATLYIISDMEFNQCISNGEMTNFKNAKKLFEDAGYTLPEVVFWNVNSRNKQSPVTKDEKGTYLVSGYSPSILKHVMAKTTCTPYDLMMEVVNSPRYSVIT